MPGVQTARVLRAYCLCAFDLARTGNTAFSSDSSTIASRTSPLKLAKLRIEEALGTCLLPSLQLIPANPAVGQEIWKLMSLLSYEVVYDTDPVFSLQIDRFNSIY